MLKTLRNSGILFLSVGILVACNSEDNNDNEVNEPPSEENNSNDQDEDINSDSEDEEQEINPDNDNGSEEDNNEEVSNDDEQVEDQMDLGIGDTAIINSSLGVYEITINSMQYQEEVDGQMSELEGFLLTDYTLKNTGSEAIDVLDSMVVLEATDMLEGSGNPDASGGFESIESFEDGSLDPGEEATGQVLYNIYDADEFYVRVIQGLLASGGVKNEVLFTIDKEEIN